MRSVTGVLLTLGLLIGLAYGLSVALPDTFVFTIQWNSETFFIPLNIAAFWSCTMTAVLISFFQMVRVMLGDAERLR